MIHDIALTDADRDWLPEDYWQSIPKYMRVGIQKHFAQRRLAMQAPTPDRWQPIAEFDGQPIGKSHPVIVAVTGGDREPVVGEAYYDPEHYGGAWWWAQTSGGEYHDSPIEEMQHGKVTHFRAMPAPPSVDEDMGVTGNAILLLGYIAGAVSRDGTYAVEDVHAPQGWQLVRHHAGNLYAIAVRQLEGVE